MRCRVLLYYRKNASRRIMDKHILIKYFSGKATPEEEALIIDWAEASPENYRHYLNERKLWDALTVNSFVSIQDPKDKSLLFWKIIGVAASASLILLLSWQQYQRREVSLYSGIQTITVPPGQRAHLMLEDHTSIWLNSNTTLTYPKTFSAEKREVTLDGEAFFDVSHNKEIPFIVKTHRYNVEVTGTTFNIYAYNKGTESFEAALLNGSIHVHNSTNNNERIVLNPNQKVTEVEGVLIQSEIDYPDHFRWREGLICMDDMPFDILMRKFAIYYDMNIVIENKALKSYRCTGKFRQSDGIEYALKVIQKDLSFTYERIGTDNKETIIIR